MTFNVFHLFCFLLVWVFLCHIWVYSGSVFIYHYWTIYIAGDWSGVSWIPGKCCNPCTTSPAPWLLHVLKNNTGLITVYNSFVHFNRWPLNISDIQVQDLCHCHWEKESHYLPTNNSRAVTHFISPIRSDVHRKEKVIFVTFLYYLNRLALSLLIVYNECLSDHF